MGQREDLLRGAKICLAEKGYARTTARDIAAASGAHLASIGYHFGSKDNLMNTAVLEATGEWADTVEQTARTVGGTTPRERLTAMLDALLAAVPADRALMVASVQAYSQAHFSPVVRDALVFAQRLARRELVAIVRGVPSDEVDDASAHRLGAMMYMLVAGLVVTALVDGESAPSGAELVGALDEFLS